MNANEYIRKQLLNQWRSELLQMAVAASGESRA